MANKESKIKVTGDTGPLNSALGSSQTKLNEFGATVSRVAKANGIELSSSIQQNVKNLAALRDHLVQIGAPAGDLDRVTRRLTEAQKDYGKSLVASSEQTSMFSGGLNSIKTIALGVAGTFSAMAIANQIKEWGAASIEFEKQFANVTTLFDTTKVDAGKLREEILSLSGTPSQYTSSNKLISTTSRTFTQHDRQWIESTPI